MFIFLQKHDDVYVDFLAIHAVINMSKKLKNQSNTDMFHWSSKLKNCFVKL